MKKLFYLLILLALQNVYSQMAPGVRSFFMQGNNINTILSTDGVFSYDRITFTSSEAGLIWPVTSPTRTTAVFASGLWIGAKVANDLRLAASIYASHYTPGNIPVPGQVPPQSVCSDSSWRGYLVQLTDPSYINGGTIIKIAGGRPYTIVYDSWASWPVDKGAPYVEVNGIPGYQPSWEGDRPGIGDGSTARPGELSFMVYMDYTGCTNNIHSSQPSLPGGTLPLGVEIHKLTFMFNCQPLENSYFVKYKIINKSSAQWDSAYIALVSDVDIGNAFDDATGCDTARNLAFTYNADNDDWSYGSNPPSFGTRVLQGPLLFTGNNNDTARLPYDTLIGYKIIGMTAHSSFKNSSPCFVDPDSAAEAYYFMKGLNGCGQQLTNWVTGQPTKFLFSGDACARIYWYDSLMHDVKNFISSGPLTVNSDDTQTVVYGFGVTRSGGFNTLNVCEVQSLSDSLLYHYYNDFDNCQIIGIQNISSEIPQRFDLFQNYPNPFNPTTKIRFNIPLLRGVDAEGRRGVLLIIYDALGREIETLVNEELNPGTYEIEWIASNYTSGVYFYSLTHGSFTQTKKMVVLK
jgi:hypothetical protein